MGITPTEFDEMQRRVEQNRRKGSLKREEAPLPRLDELEASKPTPITKRIRQSQKPLMNKLEQELYTRLWLDKTIANLRAQAKRYKLANGAWYKPDMTCNVLLNGHGEETAFEVKGGRKMKGAAKGTLTIKFAAAAWPEVVWYFCTKENGVWIFQRILP